MSSSVRSFHMHSTTKIIRLAAGIVVLLAAGAMPAQDLRSPALCGLRDTPETGIQGDIPSADRTSGRSARGYNCGLSLVGELAGGGAVQGTGHCAYVRTGSVIKVVDVSDPKHPTELRTVPAFGSELDADTSPGTSETMHLVTTPERAVLVSGSGVYDVRDCENPVFKGEIPWPCPQFDGCPHDIKISHDANRVYGSHFQTVSDISNLDDPNTWTVRNHTCEIAAGEGLEPHASAALIGVDLCDAGYGVPPAFAHGPEENGDGTRMLIGAHGLPDPEQYPDQVVIGGVDFRIIDMTVDPWRTLDKMAVGPGHGVDWFRTADGREYVLAASEGGGQDTCTPHPRPAHLGWSFEAWIIEVTGDLLQLASLAELNVNKPEHCNHPDASGQHPAISYHSVDNPFNANLAMVSFGGAGLRVFDIRNPSAPTAPSEVAYFNRGSLVHAGRAHYDAARGLILSPHGSRLQVLEVQPQIYDALGLPRPTDPAYPRYAAGRPALCDGPDLDGDGEPDLCDNCPLKANSDQKDSGGINTTTPDGIGDACQCGDVTGNGIVNGQDANAIKRHGLGAEPNPTFVVAGNCDVSGNDACNGQDANAVTRAALGAEPNPLFGQRCHNATGEPLPPGL